MSNQSYILHHTTRTSKFLLITHHSLRGPFFSTKHTDLRYDGIVVSNFLRILSMFEVDRHPSHRS